MLSVQLGGGGKCLLIPNSGQVKVSKPDIPFEFDVSSLQRIVLYTLEPPAVILMAISSEGSGMNRIDPVHDGDIKVTVDNSRPLDAPPSHCFEIL